MNTLKKVFFTIGLLLVASLGAFAQGTLRGTVTDAKSGEKMFGVYVIAKQDGQRVGAAQTDFDGAYAIRNLPVGTYDVEFSYTTYKTFTRKGISVRANDNTVINANLQMASEVLDEIEIVEERAPVFEVGTTTSGEHFTPDDIKRMPASSIDGIVATSAGVSYNDGATGTARGDDGMVQMQGNVRKRTSISVPKEAIGDIVVILGGTPASIGEAIGGTQIITLKPPSSQFKGIAKIESYLDYRLSGNMVLYLTGPLLKQKKAIEGGGTVDRTLAGFRFTGQGSYSKFGYYRAKSGRYRVLRDEKLLETEQNPLVYNPVDGSVNYAGEYLRADDFVTIKRPTAGNYYSSSDREANFRSYSIAMEAAIDFRFTDFSTLTLTGEFGYSHSPNTSIAYFPFNLTRAANGVSESKNFVITVDYTHRFTTEQAKPVDETLPQTKSPISDIMLNITAMYNRYVANAFNEQFGDNVFKYGHVGQFTTMKMPSYQIDNNYNYEGTSQTAYVQNAWYDVVSEFIPSVYNPVLANYTLQLYNTPVISNSLYNFDVIRGFKGLVNGMSPSSINSLFSNVGVQSTTYSKTLNNYFYVQAKASAAIGKHDIEMGVQFDHYNASSYGLSAYSLWTIMRNSANAHISQLDLNNPHVSFQGPNMYVNYDRLEGAGQSEFDRSLRAVLGAGATEWLDIDRYTPDFYNDNGGLEMFSSTELYNNGNTLVSYRGFDHTGKKYNGKGWNLDDFFDPSSRGHEKYQYLPAFAPLYMAGYIQDKFSFQDLIFNIGVRVDYYDGNQYVLKDPYLLYDAYTVKDLKNSGFNYNTGLDGNAFANNAKDNWVVYVDDINYRDGAIVGTPTIRGYRDGSNWYNANGVAVSSPSQIAGASGRPTPFRKAVAQEALNNGKVSSSAFEDYKPQIVVMPRIAFSFPVGEKSQFKANYDIIARRPSSGWQADYYSYMFMTQMNNTAINNPNLKPERVTNYELGFQQALNDFIGISISAYYKETRDLIQLVQYAGADPNQNYYSYGNIDFKTIKGFTFTFDMRQNKNVRISANYTLQYAEGTGLSSTTLSELIKEGYTSLKMLNPISDDRRHEFKANIDFRYADGKKYNGPVWQRSVKNKETGEMESKEVRPLENFGVNVVAVAQSGRPYTRAFSNLQNTMVGGYRGSRLPWGFYLDVVVDKTWAINIKNKDGQLKRATALNAAITVRNLLDIRNVVGVFAVTGNPTDDGYLSDPQTQATIMNYVDPQSYRDMYEVMLNNSYWNYSVPRTVRLTLTYSF